MLKSEMLTSEEMAVIVEAFSLCGLKHLRFTGGEPLLRKDLLGLIKRISASGLKRLSLTTNGYLLGGLYKELKSSGINRINISLDTLKRDRFKKITGRDSLTEVLDAVKRCAESGFDDVRLNVLLLKGRNDDEVMDFVDFASSFGLDVRFIEYFATNTKCDVLSDSFVPSAEVRSIIERNLGGLEPQGSDADSGPAQYYKIRDSISRVGFISSVTDFFCFDCNRLRLSCEGKLFPCLHSPYCIDLKKIMREEGRDGMLRSIEQLFSEKPFHNKFYCSRSFAMSSIGG